VTAARAARSHQGHFASPPKPCERMGKVGLMHHLGRKEQIMAGQLPKRLTRYSASSGYAGSPIVAARVKGALRRGLQGLEGDGWIVGATD
jgi:hypothetical protein